jgi:hypothetical protein
MKHLKENKIHRFFPEVVSQIWSLAGVEVHWDNCIHNSFMFNVYTTGPIML